ncbi:MAG TPA: DUF2550 domain-containing protein [Mycobacteriales bacterium]|nr:DUF2550 domain-containing protein [Mycobacteriales bacterium]
MGIIEILALVLLLGICGLLALALRRRYLLRGNGAIDLSLRLRDGAPGRGWALGIGRYLGDELVWYRAFTFTWRPTRVLSRRTLEVTGRREPTGAEAWSVQANAVVVECQNEGRRVEIAMAADAVTGFLSWLESQPPGYTVPGYAAG